jgi:hypothetical protein
LEKFQSCGGFSAWVVEVGVGNKNSNPENTFEAGSKEGRNVFAHVHELTMKKIRKRQSWAFHGHGGEGPPLLGGQNPPCDVEADFFAVRVLARFMLDSVSESSQVCAFAFGKIRAIGLERKREKLTPHLPHVF